MQTAALIEGRDDELFIVNRFFTHLSQNKKYIRIQVTFKLYKNKSAFPNNFSNKCNLQDNWFAVPKGSQRSRCRAVEEEEGCWQLEANGIRSACTEIGMRYLTMLGTKAAKLSCFH